MKGGFKEKLIISQSCEYKWKLDANCPYGEALDKPINCRCTDGAGGFITPNNRCPAEA